MISFTVYQFSLEKKKGPNTEERPLTMVVPPLLLLLFARGEAGWPIPVARRAWPWRADRENSEGAELPSPAKIDLGEEAPNATLLEAFGRNTVGNPRQPAVGPPPPEERARCASHPCAS